MHEQALKKAKGFEQRKLHRRMAQVHKPAAPKPAGVVFTANEIRVVACWNMGLLCSFFF